jgi:hypothetical protein
VGRGSILRPQLGMDLASLVLNKPYKEVYMTNPNEGKANTYPIDHYEGYWTVFVLLFMVFMVIALVGQMLLLNWRIWLPGAEESMNTFDSVKASAYTVISNVI